MKRTNEGNAESDIRSLVYAGKEDRPPPDAPLWFRLIVTAFALFMGLIMLSIVYANLGM